MWEGRGLALAWLQHFVLGECLPLSAHLFFDLLEALEVLPQGVWLENAELVRMLIGLVRLEERRDVVLPV